jgi:peptidoglycan hydrolase-like protein with peptidoglycan-binding domain
MVKTRVIDTPAKEEKIVIPAKYQTVTTKVQKTAPYLRWQPILCETNTTANLISKLQRILKDKKYYTGKITGKYDARTKAAVNAYQKDKKLSQGALTLKTLQSLGL